MVNFVYLIGDKDAGQTLVVDPAYDVAGIVEIAQTDDMEIVGVLGTHFHPDHIGGDMMGMNIEGVRELEELVQVPIHVQSDEIPWVKLVTDIDDTSIIGHSSGDTVEIGKVTVKLIHTPGHTPGSQCFLVEGKLVSGDTLFLDGCGRTDLPGGDPEELYLSLTQRLSAVADDTVLFPGHLYSTESSADLGTTRRLNYVFKPRTREQWLAMFG